MPRASSVRVAYDDLRTLAFGGIGAAYAAVGTAFTNPVRLIKVTNSTNQDLLISFDGVSDKDISPAQSQYVYDYGSNKADAGGLMEQPIGNRVYVKRAGLVDPTSGTVYVTVIYAAQR